MKSVSNSRRWYGSSRRWYGSQEKSQATDFSPREILSTGSGNPKHQISRQEKSYTADFSPREIPRTGFLAKRNPKHWISRQKSQAVDFLPREILSHQFLATRNPKWWISSREIPSTRFHGMFGPLAKRTPKHRTSHQDLERSQAVDFFPRNPKHQISWNVYMHLGISREEKS